VQNNIKVVKIIENLHHPKVVRPRVVNKTLTYKVESLEFRDQNKGLDKFSYFKCKEEHLFKNYKNNLEEWLTYFDCYLKLCNFNILFLMVLNYFLYFN